MCSHAHSITHQVARSPHVLTSSRPSPPPSLGRPRQDNRNIPLSPLEGRNYHQYVGTSAQFMTQTSDLDADAGHRLQNSQNSPCPTLVSSPLLQSSTQNIWTQQHPLDDASTPDALTTSAFHHRSLTSPHIALHFLKQAARPPCPSHRPSSPSPPSSLPATGFPANSHHHPRPVRILLPLLSIARRSTPRLPSSSTRISVLSHHICSHLSAPLATSVALYPPNFCPTTRIFERGLNPF